MDERNLLLLGLLMAQSRHGYSINEFIERNLGRVSGMKRATAYSLLEKLERRGFVRMDVETAGSYPPRKVYSITPAGREAFFNLLQELIVETDARASAADIALMFLDWLERDRVVSLLRQRASKLQALADQLCATPRHKDAPAVDYAVQRKLALLQAEKEWIFDLISRLEDAQSGDSPCDDKSGGVQS